MTTVSPDASAAERIGAADASEIASYRKGFTACGTLFYTLATIPAIT
jgi:hypothetical protein